MPRTKNMTIFIESRHGNHECRYCRRWIPSELAGTHHESCPNLCTGCGGEIDSEGWCPNYCMDGEEV